MSSTALDTFAGDTREKIDRAAWSIYEARRADDPQTARHLLVTALGALADVAPPETLPTAADVPAVPGWKLTPGDGLGLIAWRLRDIVNYGIAVAEDIGSDARIARSAARATSTLRAWVDAIKTCNLRVS